MGPMVHSGHLAHLRERIDALGGKAHSSTPLPALGGHFLAPTLVTGAESSPHEVFGPVATVHPYDSVDEAVALANGTAYGLEGYVVGTDTSEAMAVARRIRAGGVKVNGVSPLSLHLMAPRPAWGLSGLGAEGTVETITFFTNEQVVGIEGSL
jgi:phenylacetaldehyde dehydrogenase